MKKQVLALSALVLLAAAIQPAEAFTLKFWAKKEKPVVEAPAAPKVEVKAPEVVKPATPAVKPVAVVKPVVKTVAPAVKPATVVKPAVKPVAKAPVKK